MEAKKVSNGGEQSDSTDEKPQRKVHLASEHLTLAHLLVLACAALSAHLLMRRAELSAELALEAARLNATARGARYELVIFNRVPKVGSQTIKSLLDRLQFKNNFTHAEDRSDIKQTRGELTIIGMEEQRRYVDMFLANITPPAAYSKHISFIDFEAHGKDWQPIYINFVREPVQRIISWYYYIRAPWYQIATNENGSHPRLSDKKPTNPRFFKVPYEDCVEDPSNRECKYVPGHDHIAHGEGGSHASQIMFFCGHFKHCCVIDSRKALSDAISNVERHFAVVGVLEEMEKSLAVMERFLPRFFDGVVKMYRNRGKWQKNVNKNIYKPFVSQDIRQRVAANMTTELEFYEYCKQRLHKQYLALGLGD